MCKRYFFILFVLKICTFRFANYIIELMAEMVRVMVIQAEVMPGHILVATAEVAEREMIQIRLKRVLMDLTE